ncbi:hypothetical protein OJ997_22190 [Solirubrobacter phytolaccae]|uniref:Uncharacterized protein n=1 Tax=Solirubrobacter phytolaccae TaxID=1404360 RepID=A0A9X3SCY3_9ACTN|nr:hypothetical protein [Solirubrobacter phytolaccae]MDA0183035.1 hypothetical protein [Solirubrobacter phytolaccae]
MKLAVTGPVLALAAALTLAACGEEEQKVATHSASDKESGLSVSVAGDQVTIKRTSASAAGTGGKAGQVYCTDDYAKLMGAQEQPAPSLGWYAASLITWPEKAKSTTVTLSHALKGKPDLCVAQSTDGSAQAIMYFDAKVKTAIDTQQASAGREQQAASAEEALTSAAGMAVAAVAEDKFPAAAELVSALTAQGLIAKAAADEAAVSETGTLYVLTGETTDTQVVLAIKGSDNKVITATQKRTGDPKIAK